MGLAEDLARLSEQSKPKEVENGVKEFTESLRYEASSGHAKNNTIKGYWRGHGFIENVEAFLAVADPVETSDYGLVFIDFHDGMIKDYLTSEYKRYSVGDRMASVEVRSRVKSFDREVAIGIYKTLMKEHSEEFKKFKIEIFEVPAFKRADVFVLQEFVKPDRRRNGKYRVQFKGQEPTKFYIFKVDIEW